jgi:predicted transcriptional regulator
VDDETDRQLAQLAEARGMRKATLVRKVIKDWLRDQQRQVS